MPVCKDEAMTNYSIRAVPEEDLPLLAWTGEKRHQEYLREWMEKTKTGEIVMLGIYDGDEIIGIGHIDFTVVDDAGTLSALNVREDKRSQGLGSLFVDAFEKEVHRRGLNAIELRVETNNDRARKLYEKLGYEQCGTGVESWEQYDDEGNREIYSTDVIIMRKNLFPGSDPGTQFVTLDRKGEKILCGVRRGNGDNVALHVHGSGGNFYENPFALGVSDTYISAGYSYASTNNPGHDTNVVTENFDDSLDAIVDWCNQLAPQGRIILQGHSLGALKILRLATHRDYAEFFERVAAIVLLSPFDLVGFYGGPNSERRREHAKEFRDQYGDTAILPQSIFDAWPISARTFLELSEAGSEYDLFPTRTLNRDIGAVAHVTVPTLVVLGSEDIYCIPTAQEVAESLKASRAKTVLIEGAPHNFAGYEQQLSRAIADFLSIQ